MSKTPSTYPLSSHSRRLLAWCIDVLARIIVFFCLACISLVVAVRSPLVEEFFYHFLGQTYAIAWGGVHTHVSPLQILYALLLAPAVLWATTGVLYYSILEWLFRGRSLGKILCNLRVVNKTGTQLNIYNILIRNLLRIFDEIPIFWIVPLCASHRQRLGDMAAGTLVVRDVLTRRETLRRHLLARAAEDVVFRLEPSRLMQLKQADLQAMELLLERWPDLESGQQIQRADQIAQWIARRLEFPCPQQYEQLVFLEDILTQALQRQQRHGSGRRMA